MKAVRIVMGGIALAMLASCATTSDLAGNDVRIVQDDEYVAIVEEIAKRRGVRVQWVNPPDRRVLVATND
jgi:hypothetical protein